MEKEEKAGRGTEELLAYTDKELLECKEKLENLSDYITKWTHEIKLPLAALRLMNGRNQEASLKKGNAGLHCTHGKFTSYRAHGKQAAKT